MQYEEVNRIFGLVEEKAGTQTVEIPFSVGDVVKIMDGPFENFQAKVKRINTGERKLEVLVHVFGRETTVEVDVCQATAAPDE